ncbi:MAG: phosphatase PAP2 family protein [Clostridia bacterium]|nr:phosphatase PAP2 family protein [Clostridia bacterium]
MIATWINTTFAGFDYAILEFFHSLAVSASFILNPIMEFMSIIGDNGYFGFAIALALMLFPKTRKCGVCVFLAIAVGALFTNIAIKNIVARPRPYASDVAAFKEWWEYAGAHLESEFSFPSGHTTAAMASMSALCLASGKARKWLIAPSILYVLLMGAARNYLVVHYPTDVIAAFIVGGAAAVVSFFLTRLIWKFIEKNSNKSLFYFALSFYIRSPIKKKNASAAQENEEK